MNLLADVDRGFLGLDEEFARPADAEAVIGGLAAARDLDGVFVDHVLVGFGIALLVVHVPAEQLEEGVYDLAAHLGFVVRAGTVAVEVAAKAFDQVEQPVGGGHATVLATVDVKAGMKCTGRGEEVKGGGTSPPPQPSPASGGGSRGMCEASGGGSSDSRDASGGGKTPSKREGRRIMRG